MTRYLCIDPSHGRADEIRPVDVSAQVRSELGFLPGPGAYHANTREVVERVVRLDTRDRSREAEIRRILTGTTSPVDGPVVLSGDEPDDASDVVVLPEPPTTQRGGTTITVARTSTRTGQRVLPQGTFLASELAARLTAAPSDPEALIEVIGRMRPYDDDIRDMPGTPWRVVVECPQTEGDPPTHHSVVFGGTGDALPLDVFGTPAAGWDLVLENAVVEDLAPPISRRRAERLLAITLVVEIVTALALVGIAWASGGLGLAARESPGWLGLAVALALGAIGVGAIGLYAPREAEGNANNTLVVGAFYESRSTMLWVSTVLSAGIFALALVLALVPPMLAQQSTLPAPSVAFGVNEGFVTASVTLAATDISTDEVLTVEIRQFAEETGPSTLAALTSANGDSDGRVEFEEVVALGTDARFLSVLVSVGASGPITCTPVAATTESGCTVVAVPPLLAT